MDLIFFVVVLLLLLILLSAVVLVIGVSRSYPWAQRFWQALRNFFDPVEPPEPSPPIQPVTVPVPAVSLPRDLTVDDAFSLTIKAGAVSPMGRKQELSINSSAPIRFTQKRDVNDQNPIVHELYIGSDLVGYISDSLDSLLSRGNVHKKNDWVGGDYVRVEMEKGSEAMQSSLFNAYDQDLCTWLRMINDVLPHTMRISYSQIEVEDTADIADY